MTSTNDAYAAMTYSERFIGWSRFLVFLICLMVLIDSAVQVFEHWNPAEEDFFSHAVSTFILKLWPRVIVGIPIGTTFLVILMIFKQRPPSLEQDHCDRS